uniref:Endoplasmic reticulum-Golgi intermediate compartment protein 1 n=1 Tax=Syphacia muris TaxID=451379 RepID=A0A0N5B0L6_9BILA
MFDIRRLDIYRKVPKDLTQPTTAGAIISIVSILFIFVMVLSSFFNFLTPKIQSEMFVDDPGREGRINVTVNISLPYLDCRYVGVDIQDENGRHEVGFVHNTEKFPIGETGCRFEAGFEINKVPGNFHISTHSSPEQPANYDMRHQIHSVKFGDDYPVNIQLGSFNPLEGRDATVGEPLATHDYVLKIVPSVLKTMSGKLYYGYQYTYAHREYLARHPNGKIIPAIWFRYELQPITVKYSEQRGQSFDNFLTSICAVIGGTFVIAWFIDSMLFTLSEIYKKHQLGKLS